MNTRTKIWDTPTGYPIFFMPVGLERSVRVWGARGALPVADAAGVLSCAAVDKIEEKRKMRRFYRAPQTDTGTIIPTLI